MTKAASITTYVPSDDERRAFERDGYLITPELFGADELEAVRAAIEARWAVKHARLARAHGGGPRSKADYARVRPELARLHLEDPRLAAFCRDRRLAAIAKALLGDDVDLSWNQAYPKAPHGDPRTEIPWHQDAYYGDVDGATYNGWIAITPCTIENGTLFRAPVDPRDALRPHVWDEALLFYRCEVDEAEAEPVELRPGQAILFTGRVPHRSGPNRSDAVRVAYSLSFTATSARLRANGESFGDRIPVVRGGVPAHELVLEHLRGPRDARHEGALILADVRARAPSRGAEISALEDLVTASLGAGDDQAAAEALDALLAVVPVSEDVLGDLLTARGRADQLLEEARRLNGASPEVALRLLERALELEPANEDAQRAHAHLLALQRGTK